MSRKIDLGNNVTAEVEDGTHIRLSTVRARPTQTIYFDRASAQALHDVLRAFLGKQRATGPETRTLPPLEELGGWRCGQCGEWNRHIAPACAKCGAYKPIPL